MYGLPYLYAYKSHHWISRTPILQGCFEKKKIMRKTYFIMFQKGNNAPTKANFLAFTDNSSQEFLPDGASISLISHSGQNYAQLLYFHVFWRRI